MILDPLRRDDDEDSALVTHIATEVEAVCGAGGVDLGRVKELARAVEHYLEQNGRRGYVESQYLLLLTSHALRALGDGETGRRLFLFGSGMVRPAEWEVRRSETMWILDLKRMAVREDACLELIFFNGLRIVLDSIADLWDPSSGRGVLGLRHVCPAASELLGGASGGKRVAELADEIKGVCTRRLVHIGSERGWTAAPEVMDLDIAAG